MLGVTPIQGRLLSPQDDAANAPLTAVISYGLWQRAFGGEASVLGRDIRLNGNPCTVVGIMPRGFAFPPGELDPPELWVPLQIDPAKPGGRGSHYVNVLALLKPGTGTAQAQAEMIRYAQHSADTLGAANHPFRPEEPSDRAGRLPGRDCQRRAARHAGAARSGGLRSADRVRERGEFAAGARRSTAARDRGTGRDRRRTGAAAAAVHHRRRAAFSDGRGVRYSAGVRRTALAGGDQCGEYSAGSGDRHRLAGAAVHPRD